MDIKLVNCNGDLDDSTDNLVLVDGANAVAQDLTTRLRTVQGEWFLDQKIGVPYFRDFLVKNPNMRVIQTIIRQVIAETSGVKELVKLDISLDNQNRTLSITAALILFDAVIDGTFIYTFNAPIIGDV